MSSKPRINACALATDTRKQFTDSLFEATALVLEEETMQTFDKHEAFKRTSLESADEETGWFARMPLELKFASEEGDAVVEDLNDRDDQEADEEYLQSTTSRPFDREAGVTGSKEGFPFFTGGEETDDSCERKDDSAASSLSLLQQADFSNDSKDLAVSMEQLQEAMGFSASNDADLNALTDVVWTNFTLSQKVFEKAGPSGKVKELGASVDMHGVRKAEEEQFISKIQEERQITSIQKTTHKTAIASSPYKWAQPVCESIGDFRSKVPRPAKTYPFELDEFQKHAIVHMEAGDSVFVAAHTSAGKTVVAEYAVALCRKHLTRVIYTSPVKALSNQKYREFKKEFGDVGIVTGDVQLNADAFCVIMTTEILRSMLYNGSELARELEWVIFDEVHYVNDPERGYVWEEALIMLPSQVKVVMLSATVAGTLHFADWVGRIQQRIVYVISTSKRPVPLEHYLYTRSMSTKPAWRFHIVDADGKFLTDEYRKAVNSQQKSKENKERYNQCFGREIRRSNAEKSLWTHCVRNLQSSDLLPVIVFTFSKRRCEQNANMLISMDLTTSMEKSRILRVFRHYIRNLKASDRNLPQVRKIRNLCEQGVAVHHSGLLPCMRELVEMLFQEGFIKVLFATETFALGVNMPARSVLFDSLEKPDGNTNSNRPLLPSEYTQMAGRAGRRGLDATGTVLIMCRTSVPQEKVLRKMILGAPSPLMSRFRVTYGMVLNLLHGGGMQPEDLLQRSFGENGTHYLRRQHLQELLSLTAERDRINCLHTCNICSAKQLQDFYAIALELAERMNVSNSRVIDALNARSGKRSGNTVVFVVLGKEPFLLRAGLVIGVNRSGPCGNDRKPSRSLRVMVPCLAPNACTPPPREEAFTKAFAASFGFRIPAVTSADESGPLYTMIDIDEDELVFARAISSGKLDLSAITDDWKIRQRKRDLSPDQTVHRALQLLANCVCKFNEELVLLPDLSPSVAEPANDDLSIRARLVSMACISCPSFDEHLYRYYQTMQVDKKVKTKMMELASLALKTTLIYQQKLTVLKELQFVDDNDVLTLQGKAARMMSVQPLMLSELLLSNRFRSLNAAEIVALLAGVAPISYKPSQTTNTFHANQARISELYASAIEVFNLIHAAEQRAKINEQDSETSYTTSLAPVLYDWAKGKTLRECMVYTTLQEGVIVRCIQHVYEMLGELKLAANVLGAHDLGETFDECAKLIKRGIVFMPSLYTIPEPTANQEFDAASSDEEETQS